jgi:hypothetical protein
MKSTMIQVVRTIIIRKRLLPFLLQVVPVLYRVGCQRESCSQIFDDM